MQSGNLTALNFLLKNKKADFSKGYLSEIMLFSTSSQALVFISLFASAFLCGIVFDAGDIFVFLCGKNKFARFIIDLILTLFACFVLFIVILKYNYGELRLWCILSFILGFFIERISISKLIAKSEMWCYNKFEKFKKFVSQKREERKRKKNDRISSEAKN